MLTIGVCIPSTMALAIPQPPEDKDDWLISGYWRIIWLVPAGFAVLHSLLLFSCFNHETPEHYAKQGKEKELEDVMRKFYAEDEVSPRI